MSKAPRLQWDSRRDSRLNQFWISDKGNYKVSPVMANDRLCWMGETIGWTSEYLAFPAAAKSACQAREDKAWAKANPPRPLTDTEILDAIDKYRIRLVLGSGEGREFNAYGDGENGFEPDEYASNPRDALSAAIRKIEKNATQDQPTPTDPPMTMAEMEEICKKYRLRVGFHAANVDSSCWNVWNCDIEKTDTYAPTLEAAIRECVRKIEGAK